jgi:hypothetical protein
MVEDVFLGFAFDDELPFPLRTQLFEEGLLDSDALAIVERWIIDDGMYAGGESVIDLANAIRRQEQDSAEILYLAQED